MGFGRTHQLVAWLASTNLSRFRPRSAKLKPAVAKVGPNLSDIGQVSRIRLANAWFCRWVLNNSRVRVQVPIIALRQRGPGQIGESSHPSAVRTRHQNRESAFDHLFTVRGPLVMICYYVGTTHGSWFSIHDQLATLNDQLLNISEHVASVSHGLFKLRSTASCRSSAD